MKEEWLYFFDLYEKNKKQFIVEYSNRIEEKIWKLNNAKQWFIKKYKNHKYHNNIMVLESKYGNSPKKGRGSERPKKPKWDIENWGDDLVQEIISGYIEIVEYNKKTKYKEIIKKNYRQD